ncbi:low molecular weight protein-tyrosine-phosphatase [Vibrio splendidus]|uniref:low molecular weight protein-tyrosine-phosphatase n=1 Tax=Vibrio splendidus TaxID=29497 RepID=UPI0003101B99|nr:low molecular weight protein-tyrosine-phosphatase [Vibrio splendidus]MDP2588957.1 low molecular weight protein-tyrosine-phosphatase [Vibrio splendidus]OEE52213.1 protein-tyrosine-phosphatase [Vibrio splendidus FF-500]
MKKILVVCMGNICRSPTGEAVLRKKAQQMDIDVTVDSAGTIGFHQGNPPDSRSKSAGENRGYSFKGITSRKVVMNDFDEFDLILAADRANLDDLTNQCPAHLQYKLALFLSFGEPQYQEIPDPYYGEGNGFELVLDLIEESSEAILRSM